MMLGLDAAGKTTILYKLHIGEVLSTVYVFVLWIPRVYNAQAQAPTRR